MSELLPEGFAALEPFIAQWALSGTAHRAEQRGASTTEEREAFFAAAAPLLDDALDHLDQRPLAGFSESEERLMNLMLGLAHVAMAVEIQGPDETRSAPWRERMRITRSPADAPLLNAQAE
jgi:hypothetical protein